MIKLWKKIITTIFGLGIILGAPVMPEGNGLISVDKYINQQGEIVYEQADDERYALMGTKDGVQYNPQDHDGLIWKQSSQYTTESYEKEYWVQSVSTSTGQAISTLVQNKKPDFSDVDSRNSLFNKIITVAEASIAHDAVADGSDTSVTSLTYAHTVTGSAPILFVLEHDNGVVGDIITGITYNAAAMSREIAMIDLFANTSFYIYCIAPPDTGTNNVVISASSSANLGGNSSSYTGSQQNCTLDASNTQTSGGTIAITTVGDPTWVAGGGRNVSTGFLTAGSGVTSRNDGGGVSFGDKNTDISAGATDMIWTPDNSNTKLLVFSWAEDAPAVAQEHNAFFYIKDAEVYIKDGELRIKSE